MGRLVSPSIVVANTSHTPVSGSFHPGGHGSNRLLPFRRYRLRYTTGDCSKDWTYSCCPSPSRRCRIPGNRTCTGWLTATPEPCHALDYADTVVFFCREGSLRLAVDAVQRNICRERILAPELVVQAAGLVETRESGVGCGSQVPIHDVGLVLILRLPCISGVAMHVSAVT